MGAVRREQTRVRYPDQQGCLDRHGVPVYYPAYGAGEHTVLLMPTWEIVHSRAWKCQLPYLSRHGRVVTFGRRGNGRSGRAEEVPADDRQRTADDALAVLDRLGAGRAVVVAWCGAGQELTQCR